jgi:hypothetical protein
MRTNRSARTSPQPARPKWASVAFIFVLAAAVPTPAESLKGSSARATTRSKELGVSGTGWFSHRSCFGNQAERAEFVDVSGLRRHPPIQ